MPHVAIVTGSTSGIGEAIARALAHAGCDVMINGFGDPHAIEALRSDIARSSGRTIAYRLADLTQQSDIETLIADTQTRLGPVSVLVNNAGVQYVSPIETFPPAKWDQIIALNLTAAFHTTRLVFPGMKAAGWGRIINIASAHALVASPFKSAYVAAKHGLLGLTRASALEGASFGVRVNAICPGYVRTPLVENQIADTARARGISEDAVIRDVILAAQPTREFVRPEDVASMTTFLISDGAAQINGAALSMDGGWTAQ
jgi:3-hydroxybutyrate dehydrogenase